MKSTRLKVLVGVVVTIVVGVLVYGVYAQQHKKIADLNTQASDLQTKIITAKQQLTTTNNQNDGTVATTSSVPSNTVSLQNGQVTFSMPAGWVTATASKYNQPCYIGGLAAQFCLATSIIVPKALNTNIVTSTNGGITITVFKHGDSTTAAEWFTNDFDNVGYNVTANQLSSPKINGYDASIINPSDATPAYYNTSPTTNYYVFANKSFIVMLTYSSNIPSSTVQGLANSIKMQGN